MSRFHRVLLLALPLGIIALALGKIWLAVALAAAFAVLIGLGVSRPRLSFFGPFICRGPGTRRQVALTFDDGPDARSTPALLDLLQEVGLPAAFFCIGQKVAAEPALAARIRREGHLLENHTYTHSNFTNCFTVARLRTELMETQQAVQAATGTAPVFFRPPMGLSNPRIFKVARSLGLTVVGWTARGLDTRRRDPARIVARILRQLRPGGIILLHDGNIPAEQLVVTVRLLLANLRARGFEVVRLDQILR